MPKKETPPDETPSPPKQAEPSVTDLIAKAREYARQMRDEARRIDHVTSELEQNLKTTSPEQAKAVLRI